MLWCCRFPPDHRRAAAGATVGASLMRYGCPDIKVSCGLPCLGRCIMVCEEHGKLV